MDFLLTFERYLTFSKLNSQSFLIYFFCKPRPQFTMNFHRSANDLIGFLFVS